MANKKFEVTNEMRQVLRDSVNGDLMVAHAAKVKLSNLLIAALDLPLRKGIMPGSNSAGIYMEEEFGPGQTPEWPLDIMTPGNEKLYVATTIPNTGRIPECHVEGDYLMVHTYDIGTSIDWSRKVAYEARWPMVGRAMGIANSAMQRKKNNDGWHTILAAAVNRGLSVYDDQAASGLLTKRLVSLARQIMRRNSGGNSTSVGQGKLTHIALSPEALEDIRSWDLTQIDDVTRREIYLSSDDGPRLTRIFGVTLLDIDEFGVGQEYQRYYNTTLGATTPTGRQEIAIGLDLSSNDSFVSPWRTQPNGQRVEMGHRVTLVEQNRDGYYWRETIGYALLDSRRVLVLGI